MIDDYEGYNTIQLQNPEKRLMIMTWGLQYNTTSKSWKKIDDYDGYNTIPLQNPEKRLMIMRVTIPLQNPEIAEGILGDDQPSRASNPMWVHVYKVLRTLKDCNSD